MTKNTTISDFVFDDLNPNHEVLFIMVENEYDFYSGELDWGVHK